jgi:hypothetical protein
MMAYSVYQWQVRLCSFLWAAVCVVVWFAAVGQGGYGFGCSLTGVGFEQGAEQVSERVSEQVAE